MSVVVSYHVYPSPVTHESRIEKEVGTLKNRKIVDRVRVLGSSDGELPEFEVKDEGFREVYRFPLEYKWPLFPRLARFSGYRRWLKTVREFLLKNLSKNDVIHCHSLAVLPVCVAAKNSVGCSLLYDAHELESERAGANFIRRWYSRQLEQKCLPHVDEMWVVGSYIRQWYIENMGVSPHVICNFPLATQHLEAEHEESVFRKVFSIPDQALIYLYQGSLSNGRGIDKLLSAFSVVEGSKAHLVFMGYGVLAGRVKYEAGQADNIHFFDAVPPDVVLEYTRQADVGVALIEPICLSYEYCLPNKLFEYMHAGLAVLASDLPEIRKVLNDSGCGSLVSTEVTIEQLASLINTISPAEVAHWRRFSAETAQGYSWESQEEKIFNSYRVLGSKGLT